MQLSDFDFELPEELIASYPLEERDQSRMLYFHQGIIEHRLFKDIVEILKPGDLLVRNISKVLPARLEVLVSSGSKIEILLTKVKDESFIWEAIAGNSKRIKAGRTYKLTNGLELKITREENSNQVIVDFGSDTNFSKAINDCASMPIPPYFKREAEDLDKERYQTIYAKDSASGISVAAPTAGLHFTDEIFARLKSKGIEILDITLHVGLGTFMPIKTEKIEEHKMHEEVYEVDTETWEKILKAKSEGRRIIAIGSTSTRVLESIGQGAALKGSTDIFIYPGKHKFKIVDGMLTNFHLPCSSLILLVAAFLGLEETQRIYQEAIKNKYRFYSYGDCCLFMIE